jgi:hypothetical protein
MVMTWFGGDIGEPVRHVELEPIELPSTPSTPEPELVPA